jgi:hypothetical protein
MTAFTPQNTLNIPFPISKRHGSTPFDGVLSAYGVIPAKKSTEIIITKSNAKLKTSFIAENIILLVLSLLNFMIFLLVFLF